MCSTASDTIRCEFYLAGLQFKYLHAASLRQSRWNQCIEFKAYNGSNTCRKAP